MTKRHKRTKRYKSEALAAAHETALGLSEAGVLAKQTMRMFDEMCLTPVEEMSPELPTPGQSIAGVDGCKRGWVMIRRDEKGRFEKQVFEKLSELPNTDVVLIDIPIGLPDKGRRECDLEAKKVFGRRHGCVFTGARRPLLTMKDRERAHAWGKKQDDLGVNRQLWAILPKIREVDDWVRAGRKPLFREGHPELSFYAAAERPMTHPKRNEEGRKERLETLTGFIKESKVCEWLDQTRGSGAARDDILDALALCRSAARLALGCHCTLPVASPPEEDARGLAMEMVF